MKKFKKILIILTVLFSLTFTLTSSFADVGSFERYDSGSSSSSSWSSSSSRDYDYDYDYSSSSDDGELIGFLFGLFLSSTPGRGFLIVLIMLAIIYSRHAKKMNPLHNTNNYNMVNDSEENAKSVEANVKAIDPLFNKEDMESWSKDVFIKLQNAWTKRDWSIIRPFETNELFEQHSAQLQEYIDNNKINVMERISVTYARLYNFKQTGDKDVLEIVIKSCMKDYIIDATTKEVLEGNKTTDRINRYKLTFIRKTGVLTKEGKKGHSTTNCPNCGAPTQITSAGKCEYCGSIITTGEHDWVLSNLERI